MRKYCLSLVVMLIIIVALPAAGQGGSAPETGDVSLSLSMEGESLHKAITVFILISALSLLPAIILATTSFVRIIIVLSFFRIALGSQQTPSGRIISGLALFLTLFIMQPIWAEIHEQAIAPYTRGEITQAAAFEEGLRPLKMFMLRQTRENSLLTLMELAGIDSVDTPEDLPVRIVAPAFLLSELKTAFQMGFLLFLPFLVIDIVIATLLMSMGMIMLPPMMISLPFKLLLFIMVDGWNLLIRTLVTSFY